VFFLLLYFDISRTLELPEIRIRHRRYGDCAG
jgi:hypothetical protein